jgi:hypothetical protein
VGETKVVVVVAGVVFGAGVGLFWPGPGAGGGATAGGVLLTKDAVDPEPEPSVRAWMALLIFTRFTALAPC